MGSVSGGRVVAHQFGGGLQVRNGLGRLAQRQVRLGAHLAQADVPRAALHQLPVENSSNNNSNNSSQLHVLWTLPTLPAEKNSNNDINPASIVLVIILNYNVVLIQ